MVAKKSGVAKKLPSPPSVRLKSSQSKAGKEVLENTKRQKDRTVTERATRLREEIKEGGGTTVVVRIKTKSEVQRIDALIVAGEGADRSDLYRKLIDRRHAELFPPKK